MNSVSPHVQVLEAKTTDIPDILRFIRDLAKFEKLEDQVSATPEGLEKTLFGTQRKAECLFLEENGVKVGIAIFFHSYSTFLGQNGLYLEDLFIQPEHRSKGFGELLLAHLAKLAIERDCGRFEWSVLDWNTRALDFYRRIGAEPMNEWTVQRLTGQRLHDLAAKIK